MMVKLILVDGNKGVGDVLVLVEVNVEPLAFSQILLILKCIFESEDSYYPNGDGKGYMMKAILDVCLGVPLDKVFKRYNLENKLNVVDKRRKLPAPATPHKKVERLEDVLT